jgi:hypothetical protein
MSEKIDLNLILVVVYRNDRDMRSISSGQSGEQDQWDPTPSKQNSIEWMPNSAAMWMDPNWTGMFCKKVTPKSDSGDRNTLCSIFRVSGSIYSRHATSMQLPLRSPKTDDLNVSLCNSVKVHFYNIADNASTETIYDTKSDNKRDFLYSSAFPIDILRTKTYDEQDGNQRPNIFGVFNYNYDQTSVNIIPQIRLLVYNFDTIKIPPSITLLAIEGPNKDSHEKVEAFGDWMADVLKLSCPDIQSTFFCIRTICRDYANTTFFHKLPTLFKTQDSFLPPSLACYMACNSMIVNKMDPSFFESDSLFSMKNSQNIPILLRILRDIIVGWTMCIYEGFYYGDTSVGQSVEDQPFPLSFIPGTRLFQKDDCEGRASQAQMMVELLISMYKGTLVYDGRPDHLYNYILSIPIEQLRLNVNPATLYSLVRACVRMGSLLHSKIIQVHTVVGDVSFASFNSSVAAQAQKVNETPVGHSFGIIMYDDGINRDSTAMEATGWERRMLPSDKPLSNTDLLFRKGLVQCIAKNKQMSSGCVENKQIQINICGQLSRKLENSVYTRVYLGNDCMFFTKTPGKSIPQYGASLETLSKCVYTYPNIPTTTESQKETFAFKIAIEDLLKELIQVAKQYNEQKKSIFSFNRHPSTFESRSKGPDPYLFWSGCLDLPQPAELMKLLNKAEDKLKEYNEVNESIPFTRRCLCTPTKSEKEFENLMSSWAIIGEENIPSHGSNGAVCEGVYFSMTNIENSDLILRELLSSPQLGQRHTYNITSHPFIHSIIFNYTSNKNGHSSIFH